MAERLVPIGGEVKVLYELPLLFSNKYGSVSLQQREPWRRESPESLPFGLRYYKWMSEHYEVPILLAFFYVFVVFGLKHVRFL